MPDFGFVGTSYEAPSIYQDAQECINFFAEIDPTKQPGERGIVALYPTPGLTERVQLPAGEVRALFVMSGFQYMMAVCGSGVYTIDTSYNATLVGNLTTSTGIVSISENNTTANGLTAYVVDGTNRYTYVFATGVF